MQNFHLRILVFLLLLLFWWSLYSTNPPSQSNWNNNSFLESIRRTRVGPIWLQRSSKSFSKASHHQFPLDLKLLGITCCIMNSEHRLHWVHKFQIVNAMTWPSEVPAFAFENSKKLMSTCCFSSNIFLQAGWGYRA